MAALSTPFYFSKEISWLTSKAALHPEEIILVGSARGREQAERKEWDPWTGSDVGQRGAGPTV